MFSIIFIQIVTPHLELDTNCYVIGIARREFKKRLVDSFVRSLVWSRKGETWNTMWRREGGSYVRRKFRVDTRVARAQLSQAERTLRYARRAEEALFHATCYVAEAWRWVTSSRAVSEAFGSYDRASHGPPGRIRQPRGPFVTVWYWTRVQDLGKRISDAKRLDYRPNDVRALRTTFVFHR